MASTDSADLSVAESVDLFVTVISGESIALIVVDIGSVGFDRTASDTSALALSESSTIFRVDVDAVFPLVYHLGAWRSGTPMVFKDGAWHVTNIYARKDGKWKDLTGYIET